MGFRLGHFITYSASLYSGGGVGGLLKHMYDLGRDLHTCSWDLKSRPIVKSTKFCWEWDQFYQSHKFYRKFHIIFQNY